METFGWLGPVCSGARLAISPHPGQVAAPLSNQKQQPQKHATFAIIHTLFPAPFPCRPRGL